MRRTPLPAPRPDLPREPERRELQGLPLDHHGERREQPSTVDLLPARAPMHVGLTVISRGAYVNETRVQPSRPLPWPPGYERTARSRAAGDRVASAVPAGEHGRRWPAG